MYNNYWNDLFILKIPDFIKFLYKREIIKNYKITRIDKLL